MKKKNEKINRKATTIFIILRFLVILTMIRQIFLGNFENVLICILTLILFLIPSFLDKKFKITMPDTLEIIIYIFIFSAEILGEINEFYLKIENFDTILHTLNGFMMAGIGLSLIEIFNNSPNTKMYLDPKYLVLFGFCFSMTTGAIWEIFEYSVDKYLHKDMQKDTVITEITSVMLNDEAKNKPVTLKIDDLNVNGTDFIEKYGGYIDIGLNDTMEDIIVNLYGAIVFSLFGYFSIVNNKSGASKFMIKKEIK